jgi:hypothetical protein
MYTCAESPPIMHFRVPPPPQLSSLQGRPSVDVNVASLETNWACPTHSSRRDDMVEKTAKLIPVEESVLLHRVRCYVLAMIHTKGRSVNEVLRWAPPQNIYQYRWAGRKWANTLEIFASIVKQLDLGMGEPEFQPHGIMRYLHPEYV